jgi:hypothetical protein
MLPTAAENTEVKKEEVEEEMKEIDINEKSEEPAKTF